MSKRLKFFLEIKEKILILLKKILLHNKNSELMDDRSFDVTPVSHFVKAEPLDKKFSAYLDLFHRKKIYFRNDELILTLFVHHS